MTSYLVQAFIYLSAAVIAVSVAKRLGLGSVLGYLIAGVLIGPITGLVGDETVTIQHFAEFGVVMMLFLVGLELEPKMLWSMRHRLLGLGGLQVTLSSLAVMSIAMALGQTWTVALAIGFIFSLSSTAIVLQTFNEKGLNRTDGGRTAFSVLLFQDIAVIPMLAFIPLLSLPELIEQSQLLLSATGEQHHELSWLSHLPHWLHGLIVIASIITLIISAHYLSRPLLRFVAGSGLRELFTATALMLVIGIAALMSFVGLSPALGTFLAGVVLANSEFRHELETTIEPFKGLLLGLFFITVGAGIDFSLLYSELATVFAITLGLMLLKSLVLLLLSFVFKVRGSDRWLFTLSLAQAGEFGFVLLSYSQQQNVVSHELAQLLSLPVALSMFLTPALFIIYDKLILPRFEQADHQQEADKIEETGTVIIAGIGRFGQVVNRFLVANGVKTVVLDHQAGQVELMRKINIKSYFGDASNPDLLHTAGIEQAKLLIVAIDDKARANHVVQHVKAQHPNVLVMARAYDRGHAYELRQLGADFITTEAYYSALELGGKALGALGYHPFKAEQLKVSFDQIEKDNRDKLYHAWLDSSEENKFNANYRELFIQLESLLGDAMNKDSHHGHSRSERSWTPPPKDYQDDIKER